MEANRRAGIAGPGEAEELLEACFAPQCQAKVSVFNLVTLANGCVASASFRRETLDALEKNIDDAERLLIAHEGALVPHYLAMLLACSNNKLSACEVLEIIGARPGMTKTYTPMEKQPEMQTAATMWITWPKVRQCWWQRMMKMVA